MRKALIVFNLGLIILLFAVPTFAAEHLTTNHLHLSPSSAYPGSNVHIKGRMWTDDSIRCLGASSVKVKSSAFSPYTTYVSTHPSTGLFEGDWKIVGNPRTAAVATKCRSVVFSGSFTVRSGSLAGTGVATLLSLGVGLALTAAGGLMLIATRSSRVQPTGRGSRLIRIGRALVHLFTRRGELDKSDDRAEGSGTAATRRR